MKILITGANGFLGAIMVDHLLENHEIIRLGKSYQNDIAVDLSEEIPTLPNVDLIVHAAGKAHTIPKSPEQEAEFFKINVEGTRNLLHAIKNPPKQMILISTVAVYGDDVGEGIDESSPLKGTSPYAKSKIQAETIWENWANSHQVNFLILRLPLIVGPNPPGNLGAMIKAIKKGYYFRIGKGNARKSMVLATDVARFIPDWKDKKGIFNLTDGIHPSLADFDDFLCQKMGRKCFSIPELPIKYLGKLGDVIPFFPINSYRIQKLSSSLTYSDSKARSELGWRPLSVIGNF
ncbi:NAD-dependent epimerase/dehydratase family protein [Algoriphagus limi]|uniref:NAD-dependent epimerase/dehydratase family protein n=1 Tax=Algoriphagus limi TaxID=2975273 RepID=A0ABT2G3D2_9BACT|nr:NAD-dependent epimerase/dehydratase family protein [Algoriphagus limi]MCS5488991.1 NAD-dependent epimerase/dehydratase family protein [Algoriphagus limi]